MRNILLFVLMAIFCVAILYGLALLATADDPSDEIYPIVALLLYAGLVAMASNDLKSGKQLGELCGKVLAMVFCLGLLFFTASHIIYFVLAFLPTLAGGLYAMEGSTAGTTSGGNVKAGGSGSMNKKKKKMNLTLISVLVVFCGAVIFGLFKLSHTDDPLQHGYPIAALLSYAALVTTATYEVKSREPSATFWCKVLCMVVCLGFMWYTMDHDEDVVVIIYPMLALLATLAGCLKVIEKDEAASTAGGGDLERGGPGRLHGGDDHVERHRENMGTVGEGEHLGRAQLEEMQEWVESHPIYAFLAINPSWDVSTTFFAFAFQLYGAFDESFITVVMMAAAFVMAAISVRKDYVARERNLKNQYYKRKEEGRWMQRAWATFKCHDMMMDFFTCLTGFAGLFFYLVAGEGDNAMERGEPVIQLLNLLSVIEDVVEMLGASFSFCIGFSLRRAACYVVCSNALISFGAVYLIVYLLEKDDTLSTTSEVGCALSIVCGILTALYGYYNCFQPLEDFLKKAKRKTKRSDSKPDGNVKDLSADLGSRGLDVATAVMAG